MKRTAWILYGVLFSLPSGVIALWLAAQIYHGGLLHTLLSIPELFRFFLYMMREMPFVIMEYIKEFPVMLDQAMQMDSFTGVTLQLGYLAAAYVVPVVNGIRQGYRAEEDGFLAVLSVPLRTLLVTVATFFSVMLSSVLLALVIAVVEYFTIGVVLGWIGAALGFLAVILVISSLAAPTIIIEIWLD